MMGSAQSAAGFLAGVPNKTDGYVLTANSSFPNGIVWAPGGGGGGGGVTAVGLFDSQAPSANGAVISGSFIYMQSASASVPGLMNIGAQSFAGTKTFSGAIILGSSLQIHTNTVSNNYVIS